MADRVSLHAQLLGTFEVAIDGRAVPRSAFERPSGIRLLKLLLATPGHRVRREEAGELLWPEAEPDRSGANLRKAIHFARRALEPGGGAAETIVTEGEWLRLSADVDLEVDADELAAVLAAVEPATVEPAAVADNLATLARLAGSELLPEDPYEEWLVPIRERYRQRTLAALGKGTGLARAAGDRDLAFALLERLFTLDPADETAHRTTIELHLEAGHLHAARRQLLLAERAVAEAYGVEPGPELRELVERAAAERPRAGRAEIVEAPIVGRRADLEAAEPALDRVAAGLAGAVLLRGSAGIGKSRVLRELVGSAVAAGWRIVEARGLEASADIAFRELGNGIARSLAGTVPPGWTEPGRSALLTVAPELGVAPAIGFASDEALSAGLVDALRQLAAAGPTAIAVDDLQWLDESSRTALTGALEGLPDVPLLLLLTLRDDPVHLSPPVLAVVEAVRKAGGEEIGLGPLPPREIQLILQRDLAAAAVDDELARTIATRAAGAPLYALELLRDARSAGTLELRNGRWGLKSGAIVSVPRSIAGLVRDRAGRLPSNVSGVLAAAAELGDEVSFEELAAAAGRSPGDVLEALDAGLDGGLLSEAAGRYRFAHPLFRSALRQGLPAALRPDLHLRVATVFARGVEPTDRSAVEAAAGAGVDVLNAAAHAAEAVELGRAEAIPLAVGFGLVAGERQAALFDFEGATTTLRRALQHWYRLPPEQRRAFPASGGQVQLGWARHGARDEAGASEAFRAAASIARDDTERVRAIMAEAWMPYQHGRFDRAEAILDEGRRSITDPVATASLEADRGWIRGRRGRWLDGYEILSSAVAVLERSAPPDVLGRALDRLGVAIRNAVSPVAAIPVVDRALTLALDVGDSRLEATVRMHAAGMLRSLGRLDEAKDQLDRAIALCGLSGDRYIESVSEWISAEVEDARGNLHAAIAHRGRELEILAAIGGNPQNQAMAHAHLAHLARRLGDPAVAGSETDVARLIASHSGVETLPRQIEAALASGAWFDAGPHADTSGEGGNATGTVSAEPAGHA